MLKHTVYYRANICSIIMNLHAVFLRLSHKRRGKGGEEADITAGPKAV
jgi:hypothetical protein